MKRISLTLTLVCVMTFIFSSTCFAYNFTDYEFTDDGYIIVDDKGMDKESSAILYLYTDINNRDIKNVKNQYTFDYMSDCGDGTGITWLMYQFNPFNAKVYSTLDNAEVWIWQFALENGDYKFSNPAGSTSYGSLPNIYTLTSNFEIPKYPDNYAGEKIETETITLENKQIRLYAIYGDEAFREENMDTFIQWAKDTELSLREVEDAVNSTKIETKETIEIETELEIIENETLEKEEIEEVEEPIFEEVKEEIPENSVIDIISLIKGVGALAILCFLGFIVCKKKK